MIRSVLGSRASIGGVLGSGRGGGTPTTLDTFTAANSTNINGRTPDTGISGATWSVTAGTILIQSNAAASSGDAQAVIGCGAANGVLTLTNCRIGSSPGGYVMAIFRRQDATNYWRFILTSDRSGFSDWFLQSYSSGVVTNQAQGQLKFANSTVHTIIITLAGNAIAATVDGGNIASISNSHLSDKTTHGIGFIASLGQYIDTFQFVPA